MGEEGAPDEGTVGLALGIKDWWWAGEVGEVVSAATSLDNLDCRERSMQPCLSPTTAAGTDGEYYGLIICLHASQRWLNVISACEASRACESTGSCFVMESEIIESHVCMRLSRFGARSSQAWVMLCLLPAAGAQLVQYHQPLSTHRLHLRASSLDLRR